MESLWLTALFSKMYSDCFRMTKSLFIFFRGDRSICRFPQMQIPQGIRNWMQDSIVFSHGLDTDSADVARNRCFASWLFHF
jgi:hypothetical protein